MHRQLRRDLLEAIAADHEESAHRIGDLDAQQPLGNHGGEFAEPATLPIEAVRAAAFDIAAADHQFGLPALQQSEHLRQLRVVMLQVRIHDRDIRRARSQDTLYAGAGKSAPPDPAQATHARILLRQRSHRLPCTVG